MSRGIARPPATGDRVRTLPAGTAADERAAAAEARARTLQRQADRAERAARDARRRARRASEREARARRARDGAQLAQLQVRRACAECIGALVADGEARLHAALNQADAAGHDVMVARSGAPSAVRQMPSCARGGRTAHASGGRGQRRRGSASALRAAEEGALAAERRAYGLAALVCGQERRLTPAELDELRAGGPSGPAVLALALKALAHARSSGDRPALDAALSAPASAAIRWRDRL